MKNCNTKFLEVMRQITANETGATRVRHKHDLRHFFEETHHRRSTVAG